jgi:hypothetical protein
MAHPFPLCDMKSYIEKAEMSLEIALDRARDEAGATTNVTPGIVGLSIRIGEVLEQVRGLLRLPPAIEAAIQAEQEDRNHSDPVPGKVWRSEPRVDEE